jgi:hypothetical protein
MWSTETDHVLLPPEHLNTAQFFSVSSQSRLSLIALHLFATLLMPSNTRQKNKSAHPGAPDMTPSQLLSTGLAPPPNARRVPKKLSKDQQIAALKDELRAAQELVLSVAHFTSCYIHRDILTCAFPGTFREVRHAQRSDTRIAGRRR